ncbi:MAG TPA: HAMP domain-containing sensor histidine kinase [Myxococcaceae bacterium]|nr:HAMP domain-containing sensor histidine kinase [Myxococcaceae bacterium]
MSRIFGCIGSQIVALGVGVTVCGMLPVAAVALLPGESPMGERLAVAMAVALGAGIALAWLMGREIARPLESLKAQVSTLAISPASRRGVQLDGDRDDEIGDLASAFNRLLEALEAKTRAGEAFVADLAHELKSPVAAVRACAEELTALPVQDARFSPLTGALEQSARRLQALLSQFLELSRAEAGLRSEARERVHLGALLRGVSGAIASSARFPGVTIDLQDPGAELVTPGVAARLETAFRNLVENAASFSGEGGQVSISLLREGERAVVKVRDSGPGIPGADLPRIFERFFTTRADRNGTGLGLAMTRAVLEAHGGSVAAESPPGGGAMFRVVLPLG